MVVSHGVTTWSYLPNTYISKVEDPNTGDILWHELDPPGEDPVKTEEPESLDLGFRFAVPGTSEPNHEHPIPPLHIGFGLDGGLP